MELRNLPPLGKEYTKIEKVVWPPVKRDNRQLTYGVIVHQGSAHLHQILEYKNLAEPAKVRVT